MIFCIDCRWLVHKSKDNTTRVPTLLEMNHDCRFPSNVTMGISWLCSHELYMKKPSEINRENNCEWYMSKYKENKDSGEKC